MKLINDLRYWKARTDSNIDYSLKPNLCSQMSQKEDGCMNDICDGCYTHMIDYNYEEQQLLSKYMKGVFIRILILSNLVTYTVIKVGWI